MTPGLVIDVTPIDSVSVSGGVATVGAQLGAVYESLEQEGLAIPAGTCPPVGVAGLTLGGGLGILGRNYGVTSDHLLAAQIVLADGPVLVCLGARLALGAAGKVDRVVNLSGDQHQMDGFIWTNFPLKPLPERLVG